MDRVCAYGESAEFSAQPRRILPIRYRPMFYVALLPRDLAVPVVALGVANERMTFFADLSIRPWELCARGGVH